MLLPLSGCQAARLLSVCINIMSGAGVRGRDAWRRGADDGGWDISQPGEGLGLGRGGGTCWARQGHVSLIVNSSQRTARISSSAGPAGGAPGRCDERDTRDCRGPRPRSRTESVMQHTAPVTRHTCHEPNSGGRQPRGSRVTPITHPHHARAVPGPPAKTRIPETYFSQTNLVLAVCIITHTHLSGHRVPQPAPEPWRFAHSRPPSPPRAEGRLDRRSTGTPTASRQCESARFQGPRVSACALVSVARGHVQRLQNLLAPTAPPAHAFSADARGLALQRPNARLCCTPMVRACPGLHAFGLL